MKLLTESKIRNLMKQEEFRQNKEIIIEENTIITPSAKSYINEKNITITQKNEVPEITQLSDETAVDSLDITNFAKEHHNLFHNNQCSSKYVYKLDSIIIDVITLQKDYLRTSLILTQLDDLVDILNNIKKIMTNEMDFIYDKNKKDLFYQKNIFFISQNDEKYYPKFSDSNISLRLYAAYLELRSLADDMINDEKLIITDEIEQLFIWLLDYMMYLILNYKSKEEGE